MLNFTAVVAAWGHQYCWIMHRFHGCFMSPIIPLARAISILGYVLKSADVFPMCISIQFYLFVNRTFILEVFFLLFSIWRCVIVGTTHQHHAVVLWSRKALQNGMNNKKNIRNERVNTVTQYLMFIRLAIFSIYMFLFRALDTNE